MYGRRRRYSGYPYRRMYNLKPVKYSSETFSDISNHPWANYSPNMSTDDGNVPHSYTGDYCLVIGATNTSGMRKVKNFSIEINPVIWAQDGVTLSIPYCWALVYVPEGQNPSPNFGNQTDGGSLYEPNQNVIISGSGLTSNPTYRKFTRMARNLNSGDRIYLLISFGISNDYPGPAPSAANISLNCNYAICYN